MQISHQPAETVILNVTVSFYLRIMLQKEKYCDIMKSINYLRGEIMQFNGLSAYKGDKPYIFVSYAHADSEKVFPLLEALQKAGYRIWFDQGIEAGTEWSNNIAEHLSGCSGFLFFTSKNSVKSENCLDEVAYAKSHNKQALLAYLEEEVTLPSGTDMQTARFQRLYVNRQVSIDGFVENFMAASIFDMCRGDDEKVEAPSVKTVTQTKPEKKKSGNKALFAVLAAAIVLLAVLAVVFSSGDKGNDDQSGETLPSDTVESTVAEKGSFPILLRITPSVLTALYTEFP